MSGAATGSAGLGRRILRASVAVALAHQVFKLASVLQFMVMGHFIPSAVLEPLYVVAFEGVIFAIFLLGEEVIGPTFLPVFMREMDTKDERAAWRFADSLLTVQFLLLLVAVFIVMFTPGPVIRLLTAWDADSRPEKYELAVRSLRWLAPSLVCLSLGSATYMILNGYKRFFLAAFGDAAWKLCVALAVLVGIGGFGMSHRALVFGLLAGSVAKLATHLLGMTREIRLFRPRLSLRDPALRTMALLMLPLIGGIAFAKVRDLFNNVTVLSFLDADGMLLANSFGRKLYVTIGWLVPYALSIAMFPFLCELVDRKDTEAFGRVLSSSSRMLLSVFIPLALVCAVLARPITALIFGHGEFGPEDVRNTAVSMACYTLVLPAHSLEFLLMQAFFAQRRMVSVTVAGVVFSSMSMAISYVGVVVLGARGVWALAVVALGFALRGTLKSIALVWILKRSVAFFPPGETLAFLGRAVVTGLLSAGAAWAGARLLPGLEGRVALLVTLAAAGAAAGAVFFAAAWLLRLREPFEMLQWAFQFVKSGRGRARGGT